VKYVYVAVVVDKKRSSQRFRWRTAPSLKQALYVGRRNVRAGRLVWIEKVGQPASLEATND
jgi:hypothetical protein